ncbi:MAG TPA: zf-HC2 domain-containing protein [Candidatus Acidoferrales bacterium]|nr:zf-HC2 domain-containing protein [Candidatus Acidoferrales bacterium]
MKCDDVVLNLPDYVLDRVEPNLKRSIESHLGSCSECNEELAAMRKAITILDGVEREEYPDGFWQELRVSIMERITVPRPAPWKVPAFAGGLVVLLLAFGIGVYEYSFKSGEPVSSITSLAASLPAEQVIDLSNLNVNYVSSAALPLHETDEISTVDDSLQLAVVKSMWASVADSSMSLEDFDYTGNISSN